MNTQQGETLDEAASVGAGRSRRRVVIGIVLAVLVLSGLLVLGAWPRVVGGRQLAAAARTQQEALPAVTVAQVKRAPAETELVLPGNVQALTEATVFARADGYITRRLADIGDHVQRGQVLAEIESPELDQQIREAEATLQRARASLRQAEAVSSQAQANLRLAEITAQRWLTLAGKGVLSRQDGDEKQAALDARRADAAAAAASVQAARDAVAANEAAVQRLLELRSFRQVRAPFAGVVTVRNVDVGSLVSAGSNTSVRELFRLAQIDTLRVFVMVPQIDAGLITRGMPCAVDIEGRGSESITGTVTRTANALDAASRTLLTEVQIPNADGAVLPGSYATVHFRTRRATPPVLVPSAALRQTDKGPMVAVVQDGGVVHLQPVTPGRDTGAQTEVIRGLAPGRQVITSWTDAVREGAKVKPMAPAATSPMRGAGGQGQ
jgi:RND family efflux transporter MFP subunit